MLSGKPNDLATTDQTIPPSSDTKSVMSSLTKSQKKNAKRRAKLKEEKLLAANETIPTAVRDTSHPTPASAPSPDDEKLSEMKSSNDTAGIDSPYYHYAIEAKKLISDRFPKGAINRVDVCKKLQLSNKQILEQMNNVHLFGSSIDLISRGMVSTKESAVLLMDLEGGQCGDMTNYAIGFMKKKYPSIRFECLFLTNHSLLVIGRPKDTHNAKPNTWGKDTLICDLWSDQIYPASSLYEKQKTDKDIPYYTVVGDPGSQKLVIGNTLFKSHYLAGTPTIYTGQDNDNYDRLLMEIVAMDREFIANRELKKSAATQRTLQNARKKMNDNDNTVEEFEKSDLLSTQLANIGFSFSK